MTGLYDAISGLFSDGSYRQALPNLDQRNVRTPVSVSALNAVGDFIPGYGDVKAIGEAGQALSEGEMLAAGLLGTGAVIGLVPGAGDAVARPVIAAGRRVADAAEPVVRRVGESAGNLIADTTGTARAIAHGDASLLGEVFQRGGTPQSLSAMHARDGGSIDDAVRMARSGDAIFHSSAPSQFDEINRWGVEPSYGPWTREIAAGAVDDVDELLANAPEAAWWSDQPDWVLAKAAREAQKPVSELTVDDVRKYGHLSIGSADEYSDLAFRIPEEGLDNGEYTYVEDLAGNRMKLYETPLYEYNDYGGSSYPFGIERNEIVTREAIDPLYSLTGDELIDFMRQYDPEGFAGLLADPITQRGDEILGLLSTNPASVTDEMLDMGDAVSDARLNEYLFNNYDLPMDEASRMARAQEMGLADSQYHATTADFQSFMPSETGLSGRGVYSGDYPTDIADYATKGADRQGLNIIPLATPESEKYARNIDWQRTLDADAEFPYNATMEETIAGFKRGADTMSRQGYAGVHNQPGERVTFDPSNIRSRFARFDPRLSHLKNLSASIGGLGLLGYIAPDEQQGGI